MIDRCAVDDLIFDYECDYGREWRGIGASTETIRIVLMDNIRWTEGLR